MTGLWNVQKTLRKGQCYSRDSNRALLEWAINYHMQLAWSKLPMKDHCKRSATTSMTTSTTSIYDLHSLPFGSSKWPSGQQMSAPKFCMHLVCRSFDLYVTFQKELYNGIQNENVFVTLATHLHNNISVVLTIHFLAARRFGRTPIFRRKYICNGN
jgi:hypothetical protein